MMNLGSYQLVHGSWRFVNQWTAVGRLMVYYNIYRVMVKLLGLAWAGGMAGVLTAMLRRFKERGYT